MRYYLGVDLGGTFIKGGVVTENGKIIVKDKVPTEVEGGAEKVVANIAALVEGLISAAGLSKSDFSGVGMGVPGMIDSGAGIVTYSNNFAWYNFAVADALSEAIGLPVKIANDANVAALGETKFGCGKNYNSTIMITLGTGVGGGIVVDGRLIEGNKGAGAELGHMVIAANGELCSCGRRGCLEAYASATALIRDTKRAMKDNPASKMWKIASLDDVNGKTPFDCYDTDEDAKRVVDNYIYMLACGLVNFANQLRPEAIILGGGVCAQGDNLIKPLEKIFNSEIYAGETGPKVELLIAELGNDAGTLGGAALLMD